MSKSLFWMSFAIGAGAYLGKTAGKIGFIATGRILENLSLKAVNNMKPGMLQDAIVRIFDFKEDKEPKKKNPIGFCSNGFEG